MISAEVAVFLGEGVGLGPLWEDGVAVEHHVGREFHG